jgi:hypothetical protein
MRNLYTTLFSTLALAILFALPIASIASAQTAATGTRDTLPFCRVAEAGERCQTRNGDIRVRPDDTQTEVPIQALTATQLENLAASREIGGRWQCACSDGEGICNPALENGSLDCFAPGTGGCTGTCGLDITVDTTGTGAAQAEGPGGG